jgi:DNA-binding MarR family transcriptional regulator
LNLSRRWRTSAAQARPTDAGVAIIEPKELGRSAIDQCNRHFGTSLISLTKLKIVRQMTHTHFDGEISNMTKSRILKSSHDAEATPDAEHFDPREWPFFWMTQAVGRYLQRLESALKRIELDVSRWRVLMCLQRHSGTSVSEIAELAIVKLPTMTKIIQRMQADGLVSCVARASDGRVTEVSLTAQGVVAKQKAWTIANKLYLMAFRNISPDEKQELNRLMRAVFDGLADD